MCGGLASAQILNVLSDAGDSESQSAAIDT